MRRAVIDLGSNTMRMEIPTKVDSGNLLMFAEITDLLGESGKVVFA